MSDAVLIRLIVFCALAFTALGQASAQTPAPPPASQATKAAEPVGRLFFTPAQRASLDIARTQRARTTLSTEKVTEETAAPVAQTITYSGMVRRGDGKNTVWINGRPINDKEMVGGPIIGQVRPDGSVSLQLPQSGRGVDLRPGQSVELLSGTIEEAYSRKPVQPETKPAAKPATEAKPAAKPASPERAAEERNREEREQQRVEEAVSRALQDTANAKPGAAPAAPAAQPPVR